MTARSEYILQGVLESRLQLFGSSHGVILNVAYRRFYASLLGILFLCSTLVDYDCWHRKDLFILRYADEESVL